MRRAFVVGLLIGALVASAGAQGGSAAGTRAAAQDRTSSGAVLYVYFGYNDDISVKLADGTPIGTASGAPTQISAGNYTLALEQPGCVQVPSFELLGPGVNVVSNLSGGEVTSATDPVTFLPNSTYVWRNDANHAVANTFVTSSTVLGTTPAGPAPVAASGGKPNKPTVNTNIMGADVVPSRGTLNAMVSATGKLSVTLKGKRVAALKAGRYRVVVSDRSTASGLVLESAARKAVRVSGAAFTGKRTVSVTLAKGRWKFVPLPGGSSLSVTAR